MPAWKKGQSGNPGGKTARHVAAVAELSQAVREFLPPEKIIARAKTLLNSKDQKLRLEVLQWLTDRGYGKAPQPVALMDGPGPVYGSQLSDADLEVEIRAVLAQLAPEERAQLMAPIDAQAVEKPESSE